MLPEGDALVAVLTLREDPGESCERPLSCLGTVVGLALREDTLEWRPFLVRCCVLAASVTGCSAEDDEFCEHVSRFPGFEEKGLLSMGLGLEEEVMIAGLLPFFHA